jgi:Double zinc ribbon
MLTALFGITDSSLNLVVNLLVLVLVVIWIALVWWTNADARRRIEDPVLVATATATSLFPFIGTIVYTILRPPEYLADTRERELETKAAELRLRRLTETSCARCEHPIELSWLRCPECQHRLKNPCRSCGRPVDPRWSICPYCEAKVAGAAPVASGTAKKRPARARSEQPAARKRPSGGRPAADGAAVGARQPKRRASAAADSVPPPRKQGGAERKQTPRAGAEQERAAQRRPTPKS